MKISWQADSGAGHEDRRIEKMLSEMTVNDKIGQMSQIEVRLLLEPDEDASLRVNETALQYYIGELGIGSIFNTVNDIPWGAQDYRSVMMKIQATAQNHSKPPVIWGIDSVHGANYVHGATLTPQPLNLAATFNTTVASAAGKLASRDSRAAGMNWIFSPLLGLALQPRWSRVYETFGEDPLLVSRMAVSMIQGIQQVQQPPLNSTVVPSKAASCAKHFVGYSMPGDGHDRSPAWIPTRHLYQYFVPPWRKAIDAGVLSVMESYSETDGVPNVANPATLNYLLRQRLGFTGVLLTDFEEIRHLQSWHHVAETDQDAATYALSQASIDMSMIPWDAQGFRDGVLQGLSSNALTEDRIHESAKRALKLKQELNMFDEILSMDDPNLDLVGTDTDDVLHMVHQSIVLTKNEGELLPLSGSLKILVTGPTSNSRIYQSGGWTYQWNGAPDESWFTDGSTVAGAFSAEAKWDVKYACGTDILGEECEPQSVAKTVEAAKTSDVVVVCVGEEAYAEKPGDIRSLSLPVGQYQLVEALSTQTDTKIVLVYFGGRPRLLGNMVEQSDAVLIGFLPGPSAGDALVDIVSGRVNPSARLPITYPLSDDGGGSPYFHAVSDQCTAGEGPLPHYDFEPCSVQWPFGHGLSYATFSYSDFVATGGVEEDLQVSVKVTNTGDAAGAETVMFFTFDNFRRTTPEYKRLRAFGKVYLGPGEEALVTKRIFADDLRFVGPHDDRHYVADPNMKFWVGVSPLTDCRRDSSNGNDLCVLIGNDGTADDVKAPNVGACDAACELWANSGCSNHVGLSQHSCLSMCNSINDNQAIASDMPKCGWGWNYVTCLESVVAGRERQGQLHDTDECWKMTTVCRDIFQTGTMDEFGAGPQTAHNDLHGLPPVSYALALLAALISSLYFMYVLYGRTGTPELNDRDAPLITPYARLEDSEHENQQGDL